MRRKLILTAAISASLLLSIQAQRIKGSDTVLPVSQKQAENYMKANHSKTVSVTGGGSGVGISALLEGTTDIAQSSRRIKFSERQRLQNAGKSAKEVIVAYDALAIVVNPGNGVDRLTREQLEGIFRGKIKNWKEVGGADLRIIPYARESSSGTFEFFRESVLKNKNYMNGIMSMPATGAIVQSIRQTPGAIAYVGLAYLNKDMKAIAVSYDGGKSFAAPSAENIKNRAYPIVRPLFYYYLTSDAKKVHNFMEFALSNEGQRIVKEVGFFAVK